MNFRNLFGAKTETREDPQIVVKWPDGSSQTVELTDGTGIENLSWVRVCTELRANTISTLPLALYRRNPDGSKRVADEHPLAKLFRSSPIGDTEMSTVEWVAYGMLSHDLRGNWYCKIERNVAGVVTALVPLDPSLVQVERNATGNLQYKYDGKVYRAADIYHVANYSTDGVTGKGPIQTCREEAFTSVTELNSLVRTFNKNTIKAKDFVEIPTGLTEKQIAQTLQMIADRKPGMPFFMLNGSKHAVNPVSLTAEDAQFITSAQFSASRIAALFGVPAYKLNLSSDRKPASSAEQENMEWVGGVIRALCVKIEKKLNQKLLTEAEQGEYFFQFNMNAMLRGDIKTRSEHYSRMLQWGVFSRNDVRRLEDMEPIPASEGGDIYFKPVNMTDGSQSSETTGSNPA